ncbi:MAG: GNAT family N-acetyltransferase [Cyanobacteriota bacterium]|nr:GNAT family N-acetyltransferase [Cyanobacteriota bacterium]
MPTSLNLRWCHDIRQISAEAWQALVTPQTSPFLEYAWLAGLESAGCAAGKTGWLPCHLLVEQAGRLVAAAPMYVKSHSQGEFVFDQEWAGVARQLGEAYYPKLIGMAPFTPATGYRILVHPTAQEADLWPLMLNAIDRFCEEQDISVCSFLYVELGWREILERDGFTARITHNYQWHNQNYLTYDDFLQQFNANQRRNIKRERQAMEKSGIQMRTYQGSAIPPHFFPLMYDLYSNTCAQFWNWSKYLNRRFFQSLEKTFRDRTVFIAGEREDEVVGMSFCVRKGDRMFGRYWGCREEVKFLHFNACYYQPIDLAIEQSLQNFDPGAGGAHKIRRGFPATPVYSYHRFYRPRLAHVLIPHLQRVNPILLAELDHVNQNEVPFREDILPSLGALTDR